MNDLDQYVKTIKPFGRITHDREKKLSGIIRRSQNKQNVNNAREELIHSNLLLVVSRAIKMRERYYFLNVNVMDLIAEGNIGLMKAADSYRGDHKSKAVFGTYALKIIEQKMMSSLKMERLMHLPEHYIKYRSQLKGLQEKYGDKLTDEIIFKELKISENMLETLKDDKNKRVVSLEDEFIGQDGEESRWNDVLEDTNSVDSSEEMAKKNLMEFLNNYVDRLNERERLVIKERLIDGGDPTYENLSETLHVTRERVRQIYFFALRKLKRYIFNDLHKEKKESQNKNSWIYKYLHSRYNQDKIEGAYKSWEDRVKERDEQYHNVFKHLMNGEMNKNE